MLLNYTIIASDWKIILLCKRKTYPNWKQQAVGEEESRNIALLIIPAPRMSKPLVAFTDYFLPNKWHKIPRLTFPSWRKNIMLHENERRNDWRPDSSRAGDWALPLKVSLHNTKQGEHKLLAASSTRPKLVVPEYTHILEWWLEQYLGQHIHQAGLHISGL